MVLLLSSVIIFLCYLIYERIKLNHCINSIPLRISVTGTRGKSTVVRMLASVLRENGRKVLAKTTGSEAKIILPDGEEKEVRRRGAPSIIEQRKLLNKATSLNVDCIITEIMSIHPENHFVESQQILKPNIVIITNVRRDHIDVMGETEDEIASVFCLDISEKTKVFIPEKENKPVFVNTTKNKNGELISVQKDVSATLQEYGLKIKQTDFYENTDLVFSVGKHLNIDNKVIAKGIHKAKQDIGELKIWQYQSEESGKTCYVVNAFAANDPQSTLQIISIIKDRLPFASNPFIGLLNLRSDRSDRTIQWIQALRNGASNHFNRLYIMGAHTNVVKRKLKSVIVIKDKLPEKIMGNILAEIEDQSIIFGFGNIGGNGKKLVEYWKSIGDGYGI